MKAAQKRHHAIVRRNKPQPQRVIRRLPTQELTLSERVEQVLIGGDLTALAPAERVEYMHKVCKSLGLNPLTRPFEYILFREAEGAPARLSLYARADCAAQLRKIHRIQVTAVRRYIRDGMSYAEADVVDGLGKHDTAMGVVPLWKWKDRQRVNLEGREYANAVMKTETKAKRRATLSICGLAFLDESELDTMQVIGGVTRDGRIYEYKQLPQGEPETPREIDTSKIDEEATRRFEERAAMEDKAAQEQCQRVAETPAGDPFPTQEGPSLYYSSIEGTENFKIDGSASLKSEHGNELRKCWDSTKGQIIATPQQLGHLIRYFEEKHVKFRAA